MDGYSLKFYLLFCMKTFNTSLTNCGHRYSSHRKLSKTRSWDDRITLHKNKILLQWSSLKIQNVNYGYVKIWKRDKCVEFTSQKFQNLLCAPCCSYYFLANYCRISLLSISWSKMYFLVIMKRQIFGTMLQIYGAKLCVIKFRYTRWQYEAVHSFTVTFFNTVAYPQATVQSIVHSYTVHSKNYLSLWSTTSEMMFFVIFYLFTKWTVSLDWFNISLWCHNRLTLLEMFSSYVEKTACISFFL